MEAKTCFLFDSSCVSHDDVKDTLGQVRQCLLEIALTPPEESEVLPVIERTINLLVGGSSTEDIREEVVTLILEAYKLYGKSIIRIFCKNFEKIFRSKQYGLCLCFQFFEFIFCDNREFITDKMRKITDDVYNLLKGKLTDTFEFEYRGVKFTGERSLNVICSILLCRDHHIQTLEPFKTVLFDKLEEYPSTLSNFMAKFGYDVCIPLVPSKSIESIARVLSDDMCIAILRYGRLTELQGFLTWIFRKRSEDICRVFCEVCTKETISDFSQSSLFLDMKPEFITRRFFDILRTEHNYVDEQFISMIPSEWQTYEIIPLYRNFASIPNELINSLFSSNLDPSELAHYIRRDMRHEALQDVNLWVSILRSGIKLEHDIFVCFKINIDTVRLSSVLIELFSIVDSDRVLEFSIGVMDVSENREFLARMLSSAVFIRAANSYSKNILGITIRTPAIRLISRFLEVSDTIPIKLLFCFFTLSFGHTTRIPMRFVDLSKLRENVEPIPLEDMRSFVDHIISHNVSHNGYIRYLSENYTFSDCLKNATVSGSILFFTNRYDRYIERFDRSNIMFYIFLYMLHYSSRPREDIYGGTIDRIICKASSMDLCDASYRLFAFMKLKFPFIETLHQSMPRAADLFEETRRFIDEIESQMVPRIQNEVLYHQEDLSDGDAYDYEDSIFGASVNFDASLDANFYAPNVRTEEDLNEIESDGANSYHDYDSGINIHHSPIFIQQSSHPEHVLMEFGRFFGDRKRGTNLFEELSRKKLTGLNSGAHIIRFTLLCLFGGNDSNDLYVIGLQKVPLEPIGIREESFFRAVNSIFEKHNELYYFRAKYLQIERPEAEVLDFVNNTLDKGFSDEKYHRGLIVFLSVISRFALPLLEFLKLSPLDILEGIIGLFRKFKKDVADLIRLITVSPLYLDTFIQDIVSKLGDLTAERAECVIYYLSDIVHKTKKPYVLIASLVRENIINTLINIHVSTESIRERVNEILYIIVESLDSLNDLTYPFFLSVTRNRNVMQSVSQVVVTFMLSRFGFYREVSKSDRAVPCEPVVPLDNLPPFIDKTVFGNLDLQTQSIILRRILSTIELDPHVSYNLATCQPYMFYYFSSRPHLLFMPDHYLAMIEAATRKVDVEIYDNVSAFKIEYFTESFINYSIENRSDQKLVLFFAKNYLTSFTTLSNLIEKIYDSSSDDFSSYLKLLNSVLESEPATAFVRFEHIDSIVQRALLPGFRERKRRSLLTDVAKMIASFPGFFENKFYLTSCIHVFNFLLLSHRFGECFRLYDLFSNETKESLGVNIEAVLKQCIKRKLTTSEDNYESLAKIIQKFPKIANSIRGDVLHLLDKCLSSKSISCVPLFRYIFEALCPTGTVSTSNSISYHDASSIQLIPDFIYQQDKELWDVIIRHHKNIRDIIRDQHELAVGELSFLLKFPRFLHFEDRLGLLRYAFDSLIKHEDIVISVRREHVLEDSYNTVFNINGANFRGRLVIKYDGEIGLDHGGLTKDWFTNVVKQLFNENYGLFTLSSNGLFYEPHPRTMDLDRDVNYFKFAGKIIARSVLESVPVQAHLSQVILKRILDIPYNLSDLETVDNEVYKSLLQIRKDPITEDDDYTFSAISDNFGAIGIVDLKPNGRDIPVTDANKEEYIKLYAEYRIYGRISRKIDAFVDGFTSVIPKGHLKPFTSSELDIIICGVPQIDIEDFKENIELNGNYSPESTTIVNLFTILEKWETEQVAKFLFFLTGASNIPVGGFKTLSHKIKIQYVEDTKRLPVAHTCSNILDLPDYKDYNVLLEKLTYAIENCNSFDIF